MKAKKNPQTSEFLYCHFSLKCRKDCFRFQSGEGATNANDARGGNVVLEGGNAGIDSSNQGGDVALNSEIADGELLLNTSHILLGSSERILVGGRMDTSDVHFGSSFASGTLFDGKNASIGIFHTTSYFHPPSVRTSIGIGVGASNSVVLPSNVANSVIGIDLSLEAIEYNVVPENRRTFVFPNFRHQENIPQPASQVS